ncbi:MAG: gliding motility-associated C-terminal domain-containing protein [Flavobacteriales bacterium]|nr:gliding motility-associated C-terminal domain-containing protein [Flavobacteriales bacterium]
MRLVILFCSILCLSAMQGQDTCDVSTSITPVTCLGDSDGSITVNTGTPSLYFFTWLHAPTLISATASGLLADEYTVIVTDTNDCLSVLTVLVETSIQPPLGTITTTNISCAPNSDGSVSFTPTPGPYTWQWVDDPGLTDATRTGLGPGTYSVIIQGGVCPSFVSGFLDYPNIDIQGATSYCPASPPTLYAAPLWGFSPQVHVWNTGNTTAAFNVVPGTAGLVEVTATDTTIGCIVVQSIFLTVLPSPTVTFTAPDSVCERVDFIMNTLSSDADSIIWRWGTSGISNETDPVANLAAPFWQPVSLQGFDAFGCGNQPVTDSIYVRPRLKADFTAEQIPCTTLVALNFRSIADSCAFFIGDSLVLSDCSRYLEFDFREYEEYELVFYSTQPNRCDDTLAVNIEVRFEPTLFLPTAFTPNGDGINDEWPGPVDIPDDGFLLNVFDRWGSLLWSTTDTNAKWDGSSLPNDVYVYTMQMRDPCQPRRVIAKNGTLMLLR